MILGHSPAPATWLCSLCGNREHFHPANGHAFSPREPHAVAAIEAPEQDLSSGCLIRYRDHDGLFLARDAFVDEEKNRWTILTASTSQARLFPTPTTAAGCLGQARHFGKAPVIVWARDPDRLCQWWVERLGEWRLEGPVEPAPTTLLLDSEPWSHWGQWSDRAAAFALILQLLTGAKARAKDAKTGQQSLLSLFEAA